MRKIYKTKTRLFFHKPEILESLKIRVEESLHKPRLIIVEDDDWKEYAIVCNRYYEATGYYRYNLKSKRTHLPTLTRSEEQTVPCMFYRGIPVVNKKDLLKNE